MTPWCELDGAMAALEEAERHGDFGEILEAREALKFAHDRFSLFAASVFVAAVGGSGNGTTPLAGYVPDSIWTELADRMCVTEALKEAKRARHVAQTAIENLDAMAGRIRELENRIDSLTPGVGEK